jgi:CTP synthase
MPDFRDWERTLDKIKKVKKRIKIGMVCKYMEIKDTYISVFEALDAAGWANDVKVTTKWIDGEKLESLLDPSTELGDVQGILVPGGFGSRGVEGKMIAMKYARENKIPFLGLCYGMQLAAVEFARNVCRLKGAHTTECDPETPHPIIYIMPEQRVNMEEENYGATMRLGSYPCILTPNTKSFEAYGDPEITERHRHRFEFNQEYAALFAEKGMIISGISPNGKLVEMLEIVDHPWYVGTQAHPELKSRPHRAHPLFKGFIKAAIEQS